MTVSTPYLCGRQITEYRCVELRGQTSRGVAGSCHGPPSSAAGDQSSSSSQGTRRHLLLTHAYWLHCTLQVEFHPQLNQRNLLQFCKDHNIQFQAYSSLGIGKVRWHGNKVHMLLHSPMIFVFLQLLGDETIVKMAAKYCKTPAQLLLRWGIQHGTGGHGL